MSSEDAQTNPRAAPLRRRTSSWQLRQLLPPAV